MSSAFPSVFQIGSWTAVDWVNHLWQSTVVGGVLLPLLVLCGKLSARTRLGIGWLALGKFALPAVAVIAVVKFFGAPPVHGFASEASQTAAPTLAPILAPVAADAAAIIPTPPSALFPISIPVSPGIATFAVDLWLSGLVAFTVFWLVRGVRARRRLLAGAEPVADSLRGEIAAVAALAELKTVPRCVTGAKGHGPALVGIFSPVVVLPPGLSEGLSVAEFRAVLLHEFIHLRRRDHLSEVLRAACAGLLWFHPVAWLLNRGLRTDMEKACDERVIELTHDPDTYASGIVKTVRHTLGLHEPAFAGVATPPIVGRLKNVLAHEPYRHERGLQFLALATAIAVLGSSGYVGLIATAKAAAVPHTVTPPATSAVAAPIEKPASPPPGPNRIVPGEETRLVPKYVFNQQAGTFEVNGFAYEKTATVNFADADIRVVVASIADYFELNIVMPDSLQGRTTFQVSDGLWRQILSTALKPLGHSFAQEDGIVKVVRSRTRTNVYRLQPGDLLRVQVRQREDINRLGTQRLSEHSMIELPLVGSVSLKEKSVPQAEAVLRDLFAANGVADAQVALSILEYHARSPAAKPNRDEATLSVDFPDTDVRTILRDVADLFQLNVVIPDTLKGKVTIKLRDVTWRQIFNVALEPVGHTYVETLGGAKIVALGAPPVLNHPGVTDRTSTESSKVEPERTSESDREILAGIAHRMAPSRSEVIEGEPYLVFSKEKRMKRGDVFHVTSQGQDYKLEVVDVGPSEFTLRYRDEKITRPLPPRTDERTVKPQ